MRNRNVVGIDVVRCFNSGRLRRQVRDDLMAEEIEIDPVIGATTFFTFEHIAIKPAGGIEIVYWKSKMEKIFHTIDALTVEAAAVNSLTTRKPDSSAPCIHDGMLER